MALGAWVPAAPPRRPASIEPHWRSAGTRGRAVPLHWSEIDAPPVAANAAGPAEAPPPLLFTEVELARACAAAAQMAARREREAAAAAEGRAESAAVAMLAAELARAGEAYAACLDRIALSAARVLDAALAASGIAQRASAETLTAVLRATFAETLAAPDLRVVLAPDLLATAQRVLPAAAASAGLAGRLELCAASSLEAPPVRIEWEHGWAEADLARAVGLLRSHLVPEAPDNRVPFADQADSSPRSHR
jgi:hypothetical protein